ncbi:hypothetical protein AYI69_g4892 [Smittium culicis]|uniref:Uncharacterized protein n=1 Tax=Smittium culicis TaxID=133412 RepID=A0A1R1Y375_9FUNG|nr:hypothetical protein AYI69_g5863 [Smittium culicis]OMJ23684.1 hypothetical protein AYI69_g4892 [Smittium culicis]
MKSFTYYSIVSAISLAAVNSQGYYDNYNGNGQKYHEPTAVTSVDASMNAQMMPVEQKNAIMKEFDRNPGYYNIAEKAAFLMATMTSSSNSDEKASADSVSESSTSKPTSSSTSSSSKSSSSSSSSSKSSSSSSSKSTKSSTKSSATIDAIIVTEIETVSVTSKVKVTSTSETPKSKSSSSTSTLDASANTKSMLSSASAALRSKGEKISSSAPAVNMVSFSVQMLVTGAAFFILFGQ